MNRYGEDWPEIRKKVLKRDDYKCRRCGNPAKSIHHIIPWRENRLNHNTNLITLCQSCHKKVDNSYTRIGRTRFMKKMMIENIRMIR